MTSPYIILDCITPFIIGLEIIALWFSARFMTDSSWDPASIFSCSGFSSLSENRDFHLGTTSKLWLKIFGQTTNYKYMGNFQNTENSGIIEARNDFASQIKMRLIGPCRTYSFKRSQWMVVIHSRC